jgi:hypothetical protein
LSCFTANNLASSLACGSLTMAAKRSAAAARWAGSLETLFAKLSRTNSAELS